MLSKNRRGLVPTEVRILFSAFKGFECDSQIHEKVAGNTELAGGSVLNPLLRIFIFLKLELIKLLLIRLNMKRI